MPRVNVDVDSKTVHRKSCIVGRALLLELLQQAKVEVPPDADVYIRVPGGGDWSNQKLSLDEHNVEVRWTEEET